MMIEKNSMKSLTEDPSWGAEIRLLLCRLRLFSTQWLETFGDTAKRCDKCSFFIPCIAVRICFSVLSSPSLYLSITRHCWVAIKTRPCWCRVNGSTNWFGINSLASHRIFSQKPILIYMLLCKFRTNDESSHCLHICWHYSRKTTSFVSVNLNGYSTQCFVIFRNTFQIWRNEV